MRTQIVMIALLMSLSTLVMAQPANRAQENEKGGPRHEMGEFKQMHPNAGLYLTDEQKEAFKKSMVETQKQIQPLKNQLGELKAHQKTLMTAEKTDLAAINKNIEKMGSTKVEIEKIEAKYRLEMRAQLTDEQKLKFDMAKERMKKRKSGFDKGQRDKGRKSFRE